jgi:hypothetical protein
MRARTGCLLAATLLLAGCVTERRKTLVLVPEGALGPQGPAGPSRASRDRPPPSAGAADVPPESRVPVPEAPAAATAAPPPSPAGPYAGHRPLPAGTSVEQAQRERFLASPTTVVAERATLYLPAALAAEARLSGASVVEEAPGRRVATGDAVLVVRRLTVRAARVTLVARDDGTSDLALSARGRVAFHADLPASVIEERDLKTLLIRNDAFTPLR